jgi:integrative and conjugative element protein (TIGR02256 family)
VIVIRISPAALRSITSEAQESRDGRETGGILLGFESHESRIVKQAGGPGPGAERSASFFRRDLAHAEELAKNAFELDGSQWIGDWHTHPMGGGRPSETDLDGYLRILDADPTFAGFLSIIVTPNSSWDSLNLAPWIVERDARARPAIWTPKPISG